MGKNYLFLILIVFFAFISLAENNICFNGVLLSDARVATLKERVKAKQEPQWAAFKEVKSLADKSLDLVTDVPKNWYVPGFYRDAQGHKKAKESLSSNAKAAYALALCYRMTGDEKYAKASIRIINAWTAGIETMSKKDDSTLSFSYHYPALILAADLLKENNNLWPERDQAAFRNFLREKALPMNTMGRANNWGNWGLVLASSCAAYLKDEALLKKCAERWKYFIEHQIDEKGHLPHEVNRSGGMRGIWYSHFSLMPQTIAGEILKVNGIDLFNYTSPNGRTLKQAFSPLAGWSEKPETFPYWDKDPKKLTGVRYFSYFEILNSLWPNDIATRLIRKNRPLSADHSAPFLTFTCGE